MAKSSADIDNRIKIAFNYAVQFYNNHDRSISSQTICMQEMMRLTGFDDATCCKIQGPILSLHMMNETIQIGNKIIQEQLRIVTGIIRDHLLSIAPSMRPEEKVKEIEIAHSYPHDYSDASDVDIENHIVRAFDGAASNGGRFDINGFFSTGDKATCRAVEILSGQTPRYDKYVMANVKHCNFGYNLMEDESLQYLSSFLHWQEFNFDSFNLSNNRITSVGIESLFYEIRTAPDVRLHNVLHINLANNQISDDGAEYISESLKSGRYPNLKVLDVSGNEITEVGKRQLTTAANESLNPNLTITLEKQSSLEGVKSFMKKAFSYYAGEIKKYLDERQIINDEVSKAALKVYGTDDWAHCKKFLAEGGFAVGLGVTSQLAQPQIQQLLQHPDPRVKAVIVGAIVIEASIDSMGSVDWKDAGYCIAAINDAVSSYILPEESVGFIGENGVVDEGF